MADDKSKRGVGDRRPSKEQAQKLIARIGGDRAKLNAPAERLANG